MDAAVAALIGAGLGAGIAAIASLGVNWIQQKHQTKREMVKAAVELGVTDFKDSVERARGHPGSKVPPVSIFIHFHTMVLQALADGTYTPEEARRISVETERMMDVLPKRE